MDIAKKIINNSHSQRRDYSQVFFHISFTLGFGYFLWLFPCKLSNLTFTANGFDWAGKSGGGAGRVRSFELATWSRSF